MPNIWLGNKFFTVTWLSLLHTSYFGYYCNFKAFLLSSLKYKVSQFQKLKVLKFDGFALAIFYIIGLGQNLTLENFQLGRLVAF